MILKKNLKRRQRRKNAAFFSKKDKTERLVN